MNDRLLVSIICASYNYARFIGDAIQSVADQSYSQWELIICDDGSTDDSLACIGEWRKRLGPRIKLISKPNGGQASALNAAFRVATGNIVTILDADDQYLPSRLQEVVHCFSSSADTGLVTHPVIKMDASGQKLGPFPRFGRLHSGNIRKSLLRTAGHLITAPASGISLSRELAEEIFPIPEQEFRSEADGYVALLAHTLGLCVSIPKPLSLYRVHGANLTNSSTLDSGWCERAIRARVRIYQVLQAVSVRHGWRLSRFENNVTVWEIRCIEASILKRSVGSRSRLVAGLVAATLRGFPYYPLKVVGRVLVIALGCLLPASFGSSIMHFIFAPRTMVAAEN